MGTKAGGRGVGGKGLPVRQETGRRIFRPATAGGNGGSEVATRSFAAVRPPLPPFAGRAARLAGACLPLGRIGYSRRPTRAL